MCARIGLRADWARLAVRAERCGEEVHLACEPAKRVPRQYSASTPRAPFIAVCAVAARGYRYFGYLQRPFIYRSLYAADARVKVAVTNAACDESCADVNYFYGAGRRGAWAARRTSAPFGRGCLHGSQDTRVGTREYP